MNKFKKAIVEKKLCITIITVLLIIVIVLFGQKQDYKFTMFFQYQAIPHIELANVLYEARGNIFGEIKGFVKFDNIEDQPKNLRQYYIITLLNKPDENLSQYFSLEEIVAMQYLPPKSLGTTNLIKTNETSMMITLEDENKNLFFIDKITKEVSMKDVTGNKTTLITSELDYKDYMKEFLNIYNFLK